MCKNNSLSISVGNHCLDAKSVGARIRKIEGSSHMLVNLGVEVTSRALTGRPIRFGQKMTRSGPKLV